MGQVMGQDLTGGSFPAEKRQKHRTSRGEIRLFFISKAHRIHLRFSDGKSERFGRKKKTVESFRKRGSKWFIEAAKRQRKY